MEKLYSKIDRLSSTVNINTHALGSCVDQSDGQCQDNL
ncbi:unnamed protein product, partial [Rotaria magnacalcarata]